MNVTWNPRALRRHQQRERLGRIRARLEGKTVGDIKLGVPVVTERQLTRLTQLHAAFTKLAAELDDALIDLNNGLAVCRGAEHPKGWADVEVLEREKDVIVAQIVQRKPKQSKQPEHGDRRSERGFWAGYKTRGRR